jgi:hypothetical protein
LRQTHHVPDEIALGGNLSDAVRVGDTVRRRAGPWTPTVHALLRHLETVGFEGSPRVVGIDEQGREMLQFIEGDGPTGWPDPMPEYVWRESSLVAAARLLRRYHDALDGFVEPPGARWRMNSAEAEVICHNDVAPFNSVFRNATPIAMVDFDLAGPGRRIWDVAVGVWRWVPVSTGPMRYPRNVAERVRLFCDAYGLGSERAGLIDVLIGRMRDLRSFALREAERGDPGFVKIVGWFPQESFLIENIAYVEAHRDELSADL